MQIRTVNLDSAVVPAVTSQRVTCHLPADCPSWAASLNDCEVSFCVHIVEFIVCYHLRHPNKISPMSPIIMGTHPFCGALSFEAN